jgi:hypothetical protein
MYDVWVEAYLRHVKRVIHQNMYLVFLHLLS